MKFQASGFVVTAVAAAFALAGCSRGVDDAVRSSSGDKGGIRALPDLKGRTCAVVLGTALQEVVEREQSGVDFRTFNDYPSAVEALCLGKVDAMPLDTVVARRWVKERPDSLRILLAFGHNPYGYFLPKESPLLDRVNGVLRAFKASGEIDRVIDKWCDAPNLATVAFEPRKPGATGKAGTLRFATVGEFEPGSFIRNGEFVGFDIDLMRRIADELDMTLELMPVNMSALVPAVQCGKADIGGGCITITESRAEKVDFTDCYLDGGFSIVGRAGKGASARGRRETGVVGFLGSMRGSFIRTFVTEGRWRLMLDGLGVTLFITFLAALAGTLFAFPVWFARTSSNPLVSSVAKGYISILQGTPVLVLLMVLFYIVFGRVDIDGVWVAVIGFSLNASAYIGEMLRSGIESVPRGQTEAALALGYGPKRAFLRFVLPQAVRAILPVYRGELVGLLKSTSIVGYIAINDLTKASDLIRSRTYESFFPILTTAFVYFAAAWLLASALERIGRRLNPAFKRDLKKERTSK